MKRVLAPLTVMAALSALFVVSASNDYPAPALATPAAVEHRIEQADSPAINIGINETVLAQADATDLVPKPDPAFTGDATIAIEGETKVPSDGLVELRATGTAKDLQWVVRPEPRKVHLYEAGQVLVFRPSADTYEVITVGALGDDAVLVITPVQITGPPAPPPKPTGLEAKVIVWFQAVDVQDPSVDVVRLADSFRDVGKLIKDKVLVDFDQIGNATAASNRAALGKNIDAWKVAFLEPLAEELGKLSEAGQLETPEDHVRVWGEIETALRKLGPQ